VWVYKKLAGRAFGAHTLASALLTFRIRRVVLRASFVASGAPNSAAIPQPKVKWPFAETSVTHRGALGGFNASRRRHQNSGRDLESKFSEELPGTVPLASEKRSKGLQGDHTRGSCRRDGGKRSIVCGAGPKAVPENPFKGPGPARLSFGDSDDPAKGRAGQLRGFAGIISKGVN